MSSQRTNNNDLKSNQFIQNSYNDTSKSRIVYAKESNKEPVIAMDDRETILYDEKEFINGSIERTRENNSNPRIAVHNAENKTEMPQTTTLNESSLEKRMIHKTSGSLA